MGVLFWWFLVLKYSCSTKKRWGVVEFPGRHQSCQTLQDKEKIEYDNWS